MLSFDKGQPVRKSWQFRRMEELLQKDKEAELKEGAKENGTV